MRIFRCRPMLRRRDDEREFEMLASDRDDGVGRVGGPGHPFLAGGCGPGAAESGIRGFLSGGRTFRTDIQEPVGECECALPDVCGDGGDGVVAKQ